MVWQIEIGNLGEGNAQTGLGEGWFWGGGGFVRDAIVVPICLMSMKGIFHCAGGRNGRKKTPLLEVVDV